MSTILLKWFFPRDDTSKRLCIIVHVPTARDRGAAARTRRGRRVLVAPHHIEPICWHVGKVYGYGVSHGDKKVCQTANFNVGYTKKETNGELQAGQPGAHAHLAQLRQRGVVDAARPGRELVSAYTVSGTPGRERLHSVEVGLKLGLLLGLG